MEVTPLIYVIIPQFEANGVLSTGSDMILDYTQFFL